MKVGVFVFFVTALGSWIGLKYVEGNLHIFFILAGSGLLGLLVGGLAYRHTVKISEKIQKEALADRYAEADKKLEEFMRNNAEGSASDIKSARQGAEKE